MSENVIKNPLWRLADAIHNFGEYFDRYEKDENGNILINEQKAHDIRKIASKIKLLVQNRVNNDQLLQEIDNLRSIVESNKEL
ncbi:MAG: hypothetical protein PHE73_08535 [Sulfurovaceae bacterium]|nr:hypothetical protein [Sulfurovaceae bacterium]